MADRRDMPAPDDESSVVDGCAPIADDQAGAFIQNG